MAAVAESAVARVLGIENVFVNRQGSVSFLPQRLAIVGQGTSAAGYGLTKTEHTSSFSVGSTYGFGGPVHLASKQVLPDNGDGIGIIPLTIYPLDDDGSGVVSTGDITPSGTLTVQSSFIVRVNNIDSPSFTVAAGAMTVATVTAAMTEAINAELDMPIIAVDGTTQVNLTSKWKGVSANDITVEIIGTLNGAVFAITQPVGGLVNPDATAIETALAQVGNVWETMMLNCLDVADTTALTTFTTFGEGRWGSLVRKPLVVFTGTTESSQVTAIVTPTARRTDRVNSQLVSPGSNDLPFVVAARELARIVKVANDKPANDYGSQAATGLTPGLDSVQWDQTEREAAVQGGSSTIEVRDGVVTISDVVTFYHPSGMTNPPYRFVKDIVKLQQVLFNLDLEYNTTKWDGAPLIPDDQRTTNPDAKKPKDATAATAKILRALGDAAIISDPETAVSTIVSSIGGTNNNRLDQTFQIQLAGNVNIISITNNFGFFFGVAEEV